MRPTFEDFKEKALKKSEVKKEYDRLEVEFELKLKLIKIRKAANLTQEEMASRMNTSKSNISRLESLNSKISPTISTLSAYANAAGYKLDVNFVH
jgi:DNA-binding helix-turn-helix protein